MDIQLQNGVKYQENAQKEAKGRVGGSKRGKSALEITTQSLTLSRPPSDPQFTQNSSTSIFPSFNTVRLRNSDEEEAGISDIRNPRRIGTSEGVISIRTASVPFHCP